MEENFINFNDYRISTEILENDIISQQMKDPFGRITQFIINTREQQIIDSLIKLGWTPPED